MTTTPRSTVLVVDDDPSARLVMRAALRKAGYEVREAVGGHDALQKFQAEPCDMVMLDVEMPDLGGHEVCMALRALVGPLLPIVMVTGMDDLHSIEAAYQSGATDFISKPVNWALLGHRVHYLFRSHQAMKDLRAAEARNEAVLNAIPDLLFEVDIDCRFLECRAPRSEFLVSDPADFLGKTANDILPAAAARAYMKALHTAFEKGSSTGAQYELPLAIGSTWFELSVSRKAVLEDEKPRFIVLSREITERKNAEARIARLAYFDSLTGLPNRQSFLDRVDHEIAGALNAGRRLAVLFMDLDGFKSINDTMGHAAGDMLLQYTAVRLRDGLRPSDVLSRPMGTASARKDDFELARLGGDEFTALILNIERPEDAAVVAKRIGESMRKPFVVEGRSVTVTTSIGIAIYPDDGSDGATLLRHADTAMYHAKQTGRDNAQSYRPVLTSQLVKRMELDSDMRAALEQGQFHLVYQPQVDAASGRIRSVEALIRWLHPLHGLIPPLDFIPRAEENGLINPMGLWVLRTACAQAVQWSQAGTPVAVAVNLSPVQFRSPCLQQSVLDVLAQTGLAPELLELEVTESALIENADATGLVLKALSDTGIGIALDDFGTGYSSLAYLTRMPIDNIKIDKCFIDGVTGGGESGAIVRAILAMAHSLGKRVTAEGVETLEQARAMQAMACDCMQGYYFSRPVAAVDIPLLLSRQWLTVDPGPPAGGRGHLTLVGRTQPCAL